MPGSTSSSDDDAHQNSSELINTHVAVQCGTNICCRRPPSHRHECYGGDAISAAANAEKVADNFQSSEVSIRGLMGSAQDIIDRRILLMEDKIGMRSSSSSWEDVPVDIVSSELSGSASIALARKEVNQLRKRPERSFTNIPTCRRLQEKSCVIELAHHEEEEEEACVTPREKEHCIPLEMICPPPPRKKRRNLDPSLPASINVCKRLCYTMPPYSASASSAASSPQYMDLQGRYAAASQVLVDSPDLHTFPACIRALFFLD